MAQEQTTPALAPAFSAPVFDAAQAFRALLTAISRPGTIRTVDAPENPPAPLRRAMAAAILTLCDFDTPIWLSPSYAEATGTWCNFHVGAPRVRDPAKAAFLFAPLREAPSLLALEAGSEAYPDRSATLVLECDVVGDGAQHTLTGPGIPSKRLFASDALTTDFLALWKWNQARFPRGVDVVLTCGDRLAGLPRTTQIRAGG
ncbi:MAG: phosphonate C-P lyase system protein PhnH [Pseudomonadota bacterium]